MARTTQGRVCAYTAFVVLLICHASEAVLIGCFTTAQVKLLPQPGSFSEQDCATRCSSQKLPLYGIKCNNNCVCSASIPDVSAQAGTCVPASTSPDCGNTIQLHYVHSESSDTCELAPYPLSRNKLNLPWGTDRMTFSSGLMSMNLISPDGARAETLDVIKYGLHEIKIKAAAGTGPVSTFYLIDQLKVPPYKQNEIDLEFLNAGKLVSEPNVFWTNSWTSPRTQNIKDNKLYSSALANQIGNPSFSTTSALNTYLLDWQPTYIRWYIEGVLVDERTLDDGPIAAAPMYGIFAIWTLTDSNCVWFGGCCAAGVTYTVQFRDLKRVRCYNPADPYYNVTLATWLQDSATSSDATPPPASLPPPAPRPTTFPTHFPTTTSAPISSSTTTTSSTAPASPSPTDLPSPSGSSPSNTPGPVVGSPPLPLSTGSVKIQVTSPPTSQDQAIGAAPQTAKTSVTSAAPPARFIPILGLLAASLAAVTQL